MSTVEVTKTVRWPRPAPRSTSAQLPHRLGFGGDGSITSKGLVLVVDDDLDIRELVKDTLGFFGYRTESAGDADEAMEVIRRTRPDVITLDLAMPRRDGHSLIRELGADPGTRDIPIVVVSAYAGNLTRTSQIVRVLCKPYDVDDLLQAIDLAIASKGVGG